VLSRKFYLKNPKPDKTKRENAEVVVEMLALSMPNINYAIYVAANISITTKLVASEE